jgi:hypothetical protein
VSWKDNPPPYTDEIALALLGGFVVWVTLTFLILVHR